jgi:hypothetical protein
MRAVMATSGPALLSSNGILISSFASFATATFVPNIYFGVLTAFILAVALIADMFFTPALCLESPGREAARKSATRPRSLAQLASDGGVGGTEEHASIR